MNGTKNRVCAVLLALAMLLSIVPEAFAAEATATTMQLAKKEGTVAISNSSGRSISLIEKMRLYNGYHVETEEVSYAWINLDNSKLSKLDAVSEMEIRKSGKKLELLLNEGNIFFNVTEPLDDDESLNIRTSTIVVGIRGTCGWVKVIDQWTVEVYVLEGTVDITVTDPVTGQTKEETITGGDKVTCVVYPQDKNGDKCDILRDRFAEEDIDGFVLVELVPDQPLVEKIYEESGIDLRDWPENPEERLKEDQEEVRKKLEDIEKELEEQEEHISKDPVWEDPAPQPEPEPEQEAAGEAEANPVPSGVVTLTLPVEDDVVNDYLSRDYVRQVIVQSGNGRASTATTLEVDSGITVPVGKMLSFAGPNPSTDGYVTTFLRVDVLAGQTLEVDGFLGINSGYSSINCSGTIVNHGHIYQGVTLQSGGHIVNRGIIISVACYGGATVDNTGGVLYSLSSIFHEAGTVQGGTIGSSVESSAILPSVSLGFWYGEVDAHFINCTIESANSPAIGWYIQPDSWLSTEELKAAAQLPQMTNTIIRSKTSNVAALWEASGTYDPFVPTGYSVQQQGEWYYLVKDGETIPTLPDDSTGTVTFDANGGVWPGTAPTASGIPAGSSISETYPTLTIDHPTRTGYAFTGWNTAADGSGTEFLWDTPVNGNITVYAQWAGEQWTSDRRISYYISETDAASNGWLEYLNGLVDDGTNAALFDSDGDGTNDGYHRWFDPGASIPTADQQIIRGIFTSTVRGEVYEGSSTTDDLSNRMSFDEFLTYCNINYTTTRSIVSNSSYADVPEGAWYEEAVSFCRDNNLMNGTDATHFSPDATMTRAMMVTVLHRLAGTPAASTAAKFSDVPAGQWYAEAVSWAAENSIVGGYGDGCFGANDPVTHEQAALIFQRYSGGSNIEVAGADTPKAPATRAEIAATLMNCAKRGATLVPGTLSVDSAMDVMCAPSGIAEMKDGSFLVADIYHKLLWQVRAGVGSLYAGGETVAGLYGEPLGGYNDAALQKSYFKEPWAIAPFLDGWAVSDTANNSVRLVRVDGTETLNGKTSEKLAMTALGVAFDRPTGLASDDKGNLYISDTDNNAVRKVTEKGRVTTVASDLDQPMGLCWKDGALYIAETGANRVVKLQNGKITTVAGSGEEGLADGAAAEAAFSAPQGVTVGDDGSVYVADTGNGAVRLVRGGQVTVLAARDASLVRSGLTAPRGLLLQGDRLYICDSFSRKIFILRLE